MNRVTIDYNRNYKSKTLMLPCQSMTISALSEACEIGVMLLNHCKAKLDMTLYIVYEVQNTALIFTMFWFPIV